MLPAADAAPCSARCCDQQHMHVTCHICDNCTHMCVCVLPTELCNNLMELARDKLVRSRVASGTQESRHLCRLC